MSRCPRQGCAAGARVDSAHAKSVQHRSRRAERLKSRLNQRPRQHRSKLSPKSQCRTLPFALDARAAPPPLSHHPQRLKRRRWLNLPRPGSDARHGRRRPPNKRRPTEPSPSHAPGAHAPVAPSPSRRTALLSPRPALSPSSRQPVSSRPAQSWSLLDHVLRGRAGRRRPRAMEPAQLLQT